MNGCVLEFEVLFGVHFFVLESCKFFLIYYRLERVMAALKTFKSNYIVAQLSSNANLPIKDLVFFSELFENLVVVYCRLEEKIVFGRLEQIKLA